VDPDDLRLRLPLIALLLLIAVSGVIDLVLDAPARLSVHVLYEIGLTGAGLAGATWLWLGWHRAEQRNAVLRREVQRHQAERDQWRVSAEAALQEMARAIDRQMTVWQLTPAEREVAAALLRGRSHKEIAAATNRSDRTVRQHAAAAYRKAGLRDRAELAAFFLSDLPIGSPDP